MNPRIPIAEIMTKNVFSVSPDQSLDAVQQIFESNRFHHVPVVNDGVLIGMVSKSDIYLISQGLSMGVNAESANREIFRTILVEEVMTTKLAKLSPTDRVDVAAEIFSENLFHAIPVVDDDNKLVGMITTYDLIIYAFGLEKNG